MSSSNQDMGHSGPKENIERFVLESFEAPGRGDTVDETFELYCNFESEDEAPFDYLVCKDARYAEEIVAQSKEILSRAEKKADHVEREAYEKGFAQGQKDGYELGAKKLDKVLESIEKILQELGAYRKRFVAENETEILTLVRQVAERVVKGSVKIDQEVVRKTILEAFNLVSDPTEVRVRVSPEDLEYVKELRPEFFGRIDGLDSLTMEADPTVTRGGCYVEAGSGNVDARVETQLEMIVSAIEEAHVSPSTKEETPES